MCLLSLVGTPPTAVFVGKPAVFTATWDGGLVWPVVLAAIDAAASLFYYLRRIAPAAGTRETPAGGSTDGGPETMTVRRAVRTAPVVTLHVAAFAPCLLDVRSGLWLAIAVPG